MEQEYNRLQSHHHGDGSVIAKLPPAERIAILTDRIHHLNKAMTMEIEDRLDMIHSARMALKKAQKELDNDNR